MSKNWIFKIAYFLCNLCYYGEHHFFSYDRKYGLPS